MKELDGVNNFSVEVGESNDGINHTLDFGEGTMVSNDCVLRLRSYCFRPSVLAGKTNYHHDKNTNLTIHRKSQRRDI